MLSPKELSEIERFQNLAPRCYKNLVSGASLVNLKRGGRLFAEGESPSGIFIILKGSIKVSKLVSNGSEFVFDIFYPGESLGEVSILSQHNYLAAATALEDTKTLKISKKAYLSTFEDTNPSVMKAIKELCHRIKRQHRRIGELSAGDVEKRIASVILSIGERTQPTNSKIIFVNLSRQELSAMVGARIETVIRIISKWIELGIVEKKSRGLNVKIADLLIILNRKNSPKH